MPNLPSPVSVDGSPTSSDYDYLCWPNHVPTTSVCPGHMPVVRDVDVVQSGGHSSYSFGVLPSPGLFAETSFSYEPMYETASALPGLTSSNHWGSSTQAGFSMSGHIMPPSTAAVSAYRASHPHADSYRQANMDLAESTVYASRCQAQSLTPCFPKPYITYDPPAAFPPHDSFSSPSARIVSHTSPETIVSTPSDSGESCITYVDRDTSPYSKYEVLDTANTSTAGYPTPASAHLSSLPHDTYSPSQPHPSQPTSSPPAVSAHFLSSSPRPPATQAKDTRSDRKRGVPHDARNSTPPRLAVKRTSPRNKQVSPSTTPLALDRDDFQCPHCEHYQWNHRRPDLTRHLQTHKQTPKRTHSQMPEPDPDWVCCGVPVEKAAFYEVKDISQVTSFGETGLMMVGGCGKAFTRKGNYARHLKDLGCVGDSDGCWLPGNIESLAKGKR